jgi:hypothetical protein
MALSGSEITMYQQMYNDKILHELQRNGDILYPLFDKVALSGEKHYINKIGKFAASEKTQRNQLKEFASTTNEKRYITHKTPKFEFLFDKDEDIKFGAINPKDDITEAAKKAIGRKTDEYIIAALDAAVLVDADGSTTSTSLAAGNLIAKTANTYAPSAVGSNACGLAPWKLTAALALIQGAEMDTSTVYCFANARQLGLLSTYLVMMSKDFRDSNVLKSANVDMNLSGWKGITFVRHEGLGGGSDDYVYVVAKDALKIGVVHEIESSIEKQVEYTGNPYSLNVIRRLGVTRMYEEGVVRLTCDPSATFTATL